MNNEYNKNNSQRKNMVYGYIRVSSDKQTVENQRFELQRFCDTNRIEIDGWIEETISGTKNYKKRELGTLLSEVDENDLIICTELSRLGRNLFMIMEILNLCMSRGCRVWTVKDGYRLGDDIQSKVLAFAFGLSAEIERNLISQRTIEALARRRHEGLTLGRPRGRLSKQEKYQLYTSHTQIVEWMRQGMPRIKIAQKLKVSRNTLSKYIDTFINKSDLIKNHASQPGQ